MDNKKQCIALTSALRSSHLSLDLIMGSPRAAALALSLSAFILLAQAQDPIGAVSVPSTNTAAGVPLFEAETIQFTESVFQSLEENEDAAIRQLAPLFAFDSENSDAQQRRAVRRQDARCKTGPEDGAWPTKAEWNLLSILTLGTLKSITPIASPCYRNSSYNNYNVEKCAQISEDWDTAELHYSDPGSIMWPLYEGKTCMPATVLPDNTLQFPTGNCTQGGYPSYYIDATSVAQIQLAINLARNSNIRLVVKNTGHDYNGRSSGKDALSIWTHHLNDIRFIQSYKAKGIDYTGPVFKVGAGVLVQELYQAAEENNVTVVGGICPTVGITGGYILGGGHSPVMPLFGMGSDQVLALEVVLASGKFVTVTPSVNPDLYWAMLGGGGGTFGVVTSAILKAHPKIPVTVSTFSFGVSSNVTEDVFWQGFTALWESFPTWNAAKTYSYFLLADFTGTGVSLSMDAFFCPNKTISEYEALITPFLDNLTALGIPYTTPKVTYYPSFLPAYDNTFAGLPQFLGDAVNVAGNRLIPQENWNTATSRENTVSAIRLATENGGALPMYHQAPLPLPANQADLNSVNPAFRREGSMIVAVGRRSTDDSGLSESARGLTEDVLGPLRAASPNGGAYGNEADVNEPNWQQAFWGQNYERLLRIKKEWDPKGVFYVHHGVGSEEWEVVGGVKFGNIPTQDGRLCRKGI